MAVSAKVLNDKLRERYLSVIGEALGDKGEEVLRVGSNEIAIPVVDEDGNEKWLVLTFKVPTGSRDGDAYDGYSMAEEYNLKLKEKAEKAKAKAEKAEKDKAKREKELHKAKVKKIKDKYSKKIKRIAESKNFIFKFSYICHFWFFNFIRSCSK